MRPLNLKVVIRGAGELASGVAVTLYRAHFLICLTEIPYPLAVRRNVSFCEAVYEREKDVEGIKASLVHDLKSVWELWDRGIIPVMVDPECHIRARLRPEVLIDAIIAKKNTGTVINDAPLVIALGPGFIAGKDSHFVIETNRGHDLGRVIDKGGTEPNTGIPAAVNGYTLERVLRAPRNGVFLTERKIGDEVKRGEIIGRVGEELIRTAIDGTIRGLIRNGLRVAASVKIGDVDPRNNQTALGRVSDKARAIGGGVLEAILRHYNRNK